MFRSFLAITLSGVLLTLPSLSQTPANNQTPTNNRKPTVEQASDELLISFMALNGRYPNTDALTVNHIVAELTKRANNGDVRAAYAIARNCEYPTIATWKSDEKMAYLWYEYAMKLGSVPAMFEVGSFLYSGGGRVVPQDQVRGKKLMDEADSRGFDRDLIYRPPDAETLAREQRRKQREAAENSSSSMSTAAAVALLGLGVLFVGALASGDSSAPSTSTPSAQTCTIEYYDAFVPSIGCGGARSDLCVPSHTEQRSRCVYH